ncbi:hypothetical protein E2562_030343 [Oryza meyeriana var. granulata]|uniref:Uncharacterized protein n=1 Tax=Oryza meyeriana var. granulata TaxID=110450 RepID=A0A6G1D970_9ORYZ|nr:hypothetical protein E2562_030343 [Oryza meyeriana var. granulata]
MPFSLIIAAPPRHIAVAVAPPADPPHVPLSLSYALTSPLPQQAPPPPSSIPCRQGCLACLVSTAAVASSPEATVENTAVFDGDAASGDPRLSLV